MERQSIEDRAKRYVMEVCLKGKTSTEARKNLGLPRILVSIVNQVMLTTDEAGRRLRVPIRKALQYLDYCIWSYRDYYRSRYQNNLIAEG